MNSLNETWITLLTLIIFMVKSKQEQFENLDDSTTTTIYSSCANTEQDGLYYIKPSPNLGILAVICSNQYAMIDGSLDINLNVLPNFLTSYDYERVTTDHLLSGLDDLSTYRQWLLFADENTKFNVAPNCISCQSGQFGDNTVYYIDSHSYCFSAIPDSGCIDDIENPMYYQESCNQCDSGIFDTNGLFTKCYATQMDADHLINHDHDSCVAHGLTFRPTISNIRDACTCFKNLEDDDGVITYQVSINDLPLISSSYDTMTDKYGIKYIADNIQFDPLWTPSLTNNPSAADKRAAALADIDNRETNIVYLYNNDFEQGTYRIKESGTYIIMEDIVFNFNAPSDDEMAMDGFSPNSIDVDELYWYPTHEQSDKRTGDYPGLYDYEGAWSLGFFAGISIESDYVTIDLNQHTLSQHELFYFQQRFFAIIEMASQPFVPGQGPANWGAFDLIYPSHVVIKDGTLGLTSHQGIHGLNNDDVIITNVNAMNFDVAGVQCNACTNVEISDCVIGPQNQDIPVLGRYTHARAFIPRLKQLMEEYGEEEVTFYQRDATTIESLIDRLINQMDMIYFHFNAGVEYDEDDPEWIAAKKLFFNPSGWMDGGSSYGLILGGAGAQVVGIGSRTLKTSSITVNNVEIYGIGNKAIEKIKFSTDQGSTRLVMFDAIDWMAVSDQIEDKTKSIYIGDAYTDLTFAIGQTVDSWYFLNSLLISNEEREYVFNGDNDAFQIIFKTPDPEDIAYFDGCGTDIQLHSSKGAIGFRIDGVEDLNIDNIYIHDIYNWADLGSNWCGTYLGPSVGDEDIDIQYGYTGTRSHGMIMDWTSGTISNIQIENVESWFGEANGLTVYKGCDITLENIQVDNIHAGTQLNDDDIVGMQLPNLIPRACGVDIRPNTMVDINNDNGIINGDDIIGFQTCYDDDDDDQAIDGFGEGEGKGDKSDIHGVVNKMINGVSESDMTLNIVADENEMVKQYFSMNSLIVILLLSISTIIGCLVYLKQFMDKNVDEYKDIDDGYEEIKDDNSEYIPLL